MKKIILLLIIISITATFSQWHKIVSPTGNMILRGIIMQNDTLYSIAHGNRMVYMDNNYNWFEYKSNLNEIFDTHKQNEYIFTNDILALDNEFFILTNNGLFASFNKGKKWKHIAGLNYQSINSLKKFNDKYYAITDRLYESDDLNNWAKTEIEGGNAFSHITFSDSTIYGINNGIFVKSDNYGVTYDSVFNLKNYFNLAFGFSPSGKIIADNDKIVIFDVYNTNIFMSLDKGKSWIRNEINPHPRDIVMKGDTIITIHHEGIFYSHDNLKTWRKSKDINNENGKAIILFDEYCYAITAFGFYVSDDYGISWEKNNMNLSDIPVYHINHDNKNLYASGYFNFLYYSHKDEYFWFDLIPNDQEKDIARHVYHTYIYNDVLYSIGTGVNISYDKGTSWEYIYNRFINDLIFFQNILFISVQNDNSVYSRENGTNWINITDMEDNILFFERFVIHNEILFATNYRDGKLYQYDETINKWKIFADIGIKNIRDILSYKNEFIFTSSEKIYKYNIKTGLLKEMYRFESIIKDIDNNGPNFFILTADEEVMLSKDTCNSWLQINEGLEELFPYYDINDIAIIDSSIYAATAKGIYKASLKDFNLTSVEETETRNYLYTYPPYPQPASTEVRSLVYWDTSLEMNTESVKIYNTNGVEVGREQDITFERINAYSGNLIWNCTNVPDGVYLIQISHGDKKQTIKVMVRK